MRSFWVLLGLSLTATLIAGGMTFYVLYDKAVEQTFAQAHNRAMLFGDSAELDVAERRGGQIHYLFRLRHTDIAKPRPVPWTSDKAEGMREALSGETGAAQCADYRGVQTLAAFMPVPELKLGLVAKVDVAEVRAPYVHAAIVGLAATLCLFAAIIGGLAYVVAPIMKRMRDNEARLQDVATHIPGAILQIRRYPDGAEKVTYASAGAAGLVGLRTPTADTSTEALCKRVHPEDRGALEAQLRVSATRMTPFSHAFRLVGGGGATQWLQTEAAPRTDEDGFVVCNAVVQDVTSLYEAHAKANRLQNVLETILRCQAVIVGASDEKMLLQELANTLVDARGYVLIWFGMPEPDMPKRVWPVAAAGTALGYMDELEVR